MNIEIRKLTAELIPDYVYFFDTTPHWYNGYKCYCIGYTHDDYTTVQLDATSEEERRNFAIQCIQKGTLQGYLAYDGDTVVGWCNANTKADCLKCYGWSFLDSVPTNELTQGIKVKSIFCFVITPEMRRKGITKLLLERVCQDAAQDGFDFVEAYPEKDFHNECEDYMGPKALYEKYGFKVCFETEKKLVMRKPLKSVIAN